MKKALILIISHGAALALGFVLGVYLLPIIAAPPAPSAAELEIHRGAAMFSGQFARDLKGSDTLHWGEGTVYVGSDKIALVGSIAPGPAYRLYLSPEFVADEASFEAHRSKMLAVGDIKTFDNFVVDVPAGVELARFSTVVVWCEAFSEFITAARYR